MSGLTSRVETPRPGPNGRGLGVVRAVRVEEDLWRAAGVAAAKLETNRAEVIRRALQDVIDYADEELARLEELELRQADAHAGA